MSSAAPTIGEQRAVVGETEATKKFRPADDEVMAVRVRGLVKRYRDGTEANRGIDLDVRRGEALSILGPNGAGKTTFLRQITTELRPTAGSIEIFGVDRSEEHTSELQSRENLVCRLLLEKKKKTNTQLKSDPTQH